MGPYIEGAKLKSRVGQSDCQQHHKPFYYENNR